MFKKIIFFLIISFSDLFCQIRIVCTAALLEEKYEQRKKEYIASLTQLKNLGYNDIFIIEAINQKGPTFLDDYCKNVYYSKEHDFNVKEIKNKGINEARTLLDGLEHFKFDDNDLIVKITGRYFLRSNNFFKIIEENPGYDAYMRVSNDGIYFGCCAFKCKLLKELIGSLNYKEMKEKNIYIEHSSFQYIMEKFNKKQIKVKFIDFIDLTGICIGDNAYCYFLY